MLKPRPGVILKIHGDEHCLFDVRQGLLLPVNTMAARIWRMIQEGATEEQIIERLQAAFGSNAPACLPDDIHEFLTAMQRKNLILTDDGQKTAPTVLDERPQDNARDGMPLYHYHGMFGVMHSGYDAVVTEEVPFAQLRAGDIVEIHPDGPRATGMLFRIVRRTESALTVQGDAEPQSARRLLCACDAPQRVVAFVDPANCRHEIHGGKAGMRQFHWHRICRIVRVLRDLLSSTMPWRRKLKEAMIVNGEERYFDNFSLVARQWGETTQYLPWWNCFRYKIEKQR